MLTHNYRDVAIHLAKHSKFTRKELEGIQQAMGSVLKTAIESADVNKEYAPNTRIKGLGICRASDEVIQYYKHKNETK